MRRASILFRLSGAPSNPELLNRADRRGSLLLVALITVAGVAGACGGGSPTSPPTSGPPQTPGSPAGSCRNYATAYTYVTTAPGALVTTTARCSFDTSARTLTCDFSQASNQAACTVDFRWLDTYNSVNDFVNEPRIVGKFLLTSRVSEHVPTSTSCPGGTVPGTTTYTYDGERRLVRSVAVNPTGAGSPTVTYSYTAWDSQGRPTTGTVNIAGGPDFPVVVAYNDGDRTVTITAASASVTTITYDTDGNIVRFRGESSGFVTESMYNISSRTPVCG